MRSKLTFEKHAAELCTLLIEDNFGEVFAVSLAHCIFLSFVCQKPDLTRYDTAHFLNVTTP